MYKLIAAKLLLLVLPLLLLSAGCHDVILDEVIQVNSDYSADITIEISCPSQSLTPNDELEIVSTLDEWATQFTTDSNVTNYNVKHKRDDMREYLTLDMSVSDIFITNYHYMVVDPGTIKNEFNIYQIFPANVLKRAHLEVKSPHVLWSGLVIGEAHYIQDRSPDSPTVLNIDRTILDLIPNQVWGWLVAFSI